MYKVIVRFTADRDQTGLLEVQSPEGKRLSGPFAVCGRADDLSARDHKNPERNPLLPFGDTPFGDYRVTGVLESGEGTDYSSEEYGPAGIVLLQPRNGDAALADANGRFVFFIQGGDPSPDGGLRPTNGSLRLYNRDQKRLVSLLQRTQGSICVVVETTGLKGTLSVASAAARRAPPYSSRPALRLSRASPRSQMLTMFWLRTVMGASGVLMAMRGALGFTAGNLHADPGENLRTVQTAKGDALRLSGKPQFTRGRLFAEAGGDYTQPTPVLPVTPFPHSPPRHVPPPVRPPPVQPPPVQPQPVQPQPVQPQPVQPPPVRPAPIKPPPVRPQPVNPSPPVAPPPAPAPSAVQIGGAAEVKGEVYWLTPSGSKVPITTGKPIFLNQRVVTGPNGGLRVLLQDETVFTLGPSSDMVLDEFVYDPSTSAGKITATITKGIFRFVTGKIQERQPYNIKVNTAVDCLCFRGTDFEASIGSDQTGYIRMFKGMLDIVQTKTGKVTTVTAGQTVTLKADGSVVPSKRPK